MGRAEMGEKRLLTVQPEEIERRLWIREPPAAPHRGRFSLWNEPSYYEVAKKVAPMFAVALVYSVAFSGMTCVFGQILESHHYSRFCAHSLGMLCSLAVAGGTFVPIRHRIHSMMSILPSPF